MTTPNAAAKAAGGLFIALWWIAATAGAEVGEKIDRDGRSGRPHFVRTRTRTSQLNEGRSFGDDDIDIPGTTTTSTRSSSGRRRRLDSCTTFTTCSGPTGLSAALYSAAALGQTLRVCPSSTPIRCRTTKNSGPASIALGSATSPLSASLECASTNLGESGGRCILDLSPGENLDPNYAAYSAIYLRHSGNSLTVRGFELRGVRGSSRVAYVRDGAAVHFHECVFRDNVHKNGNSPVMVLDYGSPMPTKTITNSYVADNVGSWLGFPSGTAVLRGNVFYNNVAVPDQKANFISNKEVGSSQFVLEDNWFLSNNSTGARTYTWMVFTEDRSKTREELLSDVGGNCASDNVIAGKYASIGIDQCHNGIFTKNAWPYACTYFDPCVPAAATSSPPLPCDAFESGSCDSSSSGTASPTPPPTSIPTQSPTPRVPVTYFVDCRDGNDALDGRSRVTAWRDPARAVADVAPGDQVLIRGGEGRVCPTTINLESNGEEGSPILWRGGWPEDESDDGSSKAIVWGGSVLQNKASLDDTSTDLGSLGIEGVGTDHPHWADLYIADLPLGLTTEEDDDINLFNGEAASASAQRMSVAQWPNQPSPFRADDTAHYLSIPKDQVTNTTLRDDRLAQEWTAAILLRSHALVWVYGNRVDRRQIVSFDPASSTITFDSPLLPYDDRDTKYALAGAVEFIDSPGEYAIVSSSSSTSQHVVAYPYNRDADLTSSTRTRGVDLNFHSYNEIHNIEFAQFGGNQAFDGSAIYAGFASSKIKGFRLTDCVIRHNYKRKGDTIRLNSLQAPIFSRNVIYDNANQRGISLLHSDQALISKNVVSGGSIYCGGCTHSIISDNIVQGSLPVHANGITIYQGSNFTISARNRISTVGDSISLTIKESNGVCVVGNELISQDAPSLALWKTTDDSSNTVALIHNYLSESFVMSDTLASCSIVNNALGGQPPEIEQYRNSNTIHHNLHHKLSWSQDAAYGWTPYPADVMAADLPTSSLFADQANGDFFPVRGAPSINAGSAISSIEQSAMSDVLTKDSQGMYHPEALPVLQYLLIDKSNSSRLDTVAPDIGPLEFIFTPTASPTTGTDAPSLAPSVSSSPTGIIIHEQPTQPSSEEECTPQDDFAGCGENPLEYFVDPVYGDDENAGTSNATAIRSISRAIELANDNPSTPLLFHLAGGYYGEFGVGPWTNPFTSRNTPSEWIRFVASTSNDGENPVIFNNIEVNSQVPQECRIAIVGGRVNSTAPGSSGDNNAIEIRRSSHVRIHMVVVDPQNLDIWQEFSRKPQGVYTREASNIIISESEFIGGRYGLVFGALGRWIQVINCNVHHQFEDAIRIASVENIVIRGNHIHHVNDYYSTGQHIDGIQFFPSGPSGRYYYPQSHNVLIAGNLFTEMIGQMIFVQANYIDQIGFMQNISICTNILGPKTLNDASCPVQVQGVKNYEFQNNTVVDTVLIRRESSGVLLGNIFGNLQVAEDAEVLPGSDCNVLGLVQVSSEGTVDLGSSVVSPTTYANVDLYDFAPMTMDACSGGLDGLHAGAVPCRVCEWTSISQNGPITNFAVNPSRISVDQTLVTLNPFSSQICGDTNFASASWYVSDGRILNSADLQEAKEICLPSQGIYSIQYNVTDDNGGQDLFSRQAIRETSAVDGLVARYPLSTSFLADISPNKHPVAALSAPHNSTFAYDRCDFNSYIDLGYEDSIVLPESVRNSVNLKSGLTAALWARALGPGQLLYKHVTVGIWIESSSEVHFAVGTNANSTHNAWFAENAATASFGQSFNGDWHHYAVTFNGTDVLGYINGTLVASRAVPATYSMGQIRDGNWDMVIGHRTWKGRNLVGGVKDFRLYDRYLSEQEILLLSSDTVDCETHALGCDGNAFIH